MTINKDIFIPIDSCPLCDSNESKVARTEVNKFYTINEEQKKFFAVYEQIPVLMQLCKICDFAYIDRLPKAPVFYEKLYSQIEYNYDYEFKHHGKKEIYKDIKRHLKKYCTSGSLLDIGTWCGTLLAYMSDTYSVVGCELSNSAAEYGRSIGLDILSGSFEAANFPSESFDIITIIDVLEHLPSPKNVLEKIIALLKVNGILYIKVPNGKAQIQKQNLLQHLKLSDQGVGQNFVHINHFNHKSLKRVLGLLGLEVLEMGYTKSEIWDLTAPQPTYLKLKQQQENIIRNLGTGIASFVSHVSPVDIGFNIYVIAKKSGVSKI